MVFSCVGYGIKGDLYCHKSSVNNKEFQKSFKNVVYPIINKLKKNYKNYLVILENGIIIINIKLDAIESRNNDLLIKK